MSVYKGTKSPFYGYDFQIDGRRFFGSTKARNKKDAEAVERELKTKAKSDLAEEKRVGSGPLTLDIAFGKYWTEIGQHHANAQTTWRDLERILGYFGKARRLDEIGDAELAALVAWRRAQTPKGRKAVKGKPVASIAPATVNRSTVELLKAVMGRGRRTWRYSFPKEPNWKEHRLKEPEERVRELDEGEGHALDAAVRGDYADWFEFARLTGLRRNETLISWRNVNMFAKQITTTGKGNRTVRTPITDDVKAVLDRCKGHHPEAVFTFICQRPLEGQVRGQRYPITAEGAKTQWRRLKARSKVGSFRFHDIRHDVATKLLRDTGNLKLVQQALNRSDIKTTTKYAHVIGDEVATALANLSKSRNLSRSKKAGVS